MRGLRPQKRFATHLSQHRLAETRFCSVTGSCVEAIHDWNLPIPSQGCNYYADLPPSASKRLAHLQRSLRPHEPPSLAFPPTDIDTQASAGTLRCSDKESR